VLQMQPSAIGQHRGDRPGHFPASADVSGQG
jgi:hypothetical protein